MRSALRFAAVAGAAAAVTLTAPPALAATTTDVIDAANVISSTQEQQIETTAGRFAQDVRLFVVTAPLTDPGPQDEALEEYLHELGENVGWTGSAWGSDVIVLAVAPSPAVRLQYLNCGAAVDADVCAGYRTDVVTGAMAPAFREGNFGRGLLAGVTMIGKGLSTGIPNTADTGTDFEGETAPPDHTGWYVVGGLGVAGAGYAGGRKLLERRRVKRAEQDRQRKLDAAKAQNSVLASELRSRLNENELLISSIPTSPLQDQLEADLATVQKNLRAADAETDPLAAQKEFAVVGASVASLDRRITLLRRTPGWEVAWSGEVQGLRDQLETLGTLAARFAEFSQAAPQVPDLTDRLDRLEADVREGRAPIESGLTEVLTTDRDLRARVFQADQQLDKLIAAREAERRQAEEQARRRRDEESARRKAQDEAYYSRDSDGWLGWWLGSTISRSGRSGGGWGGGGWGGGSRGGSRSGGGGFGGGSSGSRSGGSSISRGGGGGTRSW